MHYDDFMAELKSILTSKQTFQTIEQDKEFDAVYSGPVVTITPSSSKKDWSPINLNEFYHIWKIARNLPKNERFHPSHYQKDTRSASYILFFFKHILKDEDME